MIMKFDVDWENSEIYCAFNTQNQSIFFSLSIFQFFFIVDKENEILVPISKKRLTEKDGYVPEKFSVEILYGSVCMQ